MPLRLAAADRARELDRAGVEQQLFRQRRLARVGMRDDGERPAPGDLRRERVAGRLRASSEMDDMLNCDLYWIRLELGFGCAQDLDRAPCRRSSPWLPGADRDSAAGRRNLTRCSAFLRSVPGRPFPDTRLRTSIRTIRRHSRRGSNSRWRALRGHRAERPIGDPQGEARRPARSSSSAALAGLLRRGHHGLERPIVQLTWQSQIGFVYDRTRSSAPHLQYTGEGWGLTHDGDQPDHERRHAPICASSIRRRYGDAPHRASPTAAAGDATSTSSNG